MRRVAIRLVLTLLCLGLPAAAAERQEKPAPPAKKAAAHPLDPDPGVFEFVPKPNAETRTRIIALIGRLGHRDWTVRVAATRDLLGIGQSALPYAEKGLSLYRDPEVRYRLRVLLARGKWSTTKRLRWLARKGILVIVNAAWTDAKVRDRIRAEILREGKRLVRIPEIRDSLFAKSDEVRRHTVQLVVDIARRHRDRFAVGLLVEVLGRAYHLRQTTERACGLTERVAAEALKELTKPSWHASAGDKWRAWWKEKGKTFAFPKKEDK